MENGVKAALIRYGLHKLAQATGQDSWEELLQTIPEEGGAADLRWTEYERCLYRGQEAQPEQALTCILSLIREEGSLPAPVYHRPQALSFSPDFSLFPGPGNEAHAPAADLWNRFRAEFEAIPFREIRPFFEAFYHLYLKYTWAVPCTYGERGVSLFEQWKAVAALAHASFGQEKPLPTLSLIGGDFPGIQTFVYTITSKGAAKGLRGRSFFLQLLCQAVVRRLVKELDLCWANVIYVAGGNFLLVGPPLERQVLGGTVESRLKDLQGHVDEVLLQELEGDLALALAWKRLRTSDVSQGTFGREACRALRESVAERKGQPFATLAESRWGDLFGPQGRPGNRYCVICHRPLAQDEGLSMEGPAEPATGESPLRCRACYGFQRLAECIADAGLLTIALKRASHGGERWQEILWRVSGHWYDFVSGPGERVSAQDTFRYTLNDTEFIGKKAHGFALVANVTPKVTEADVKRWRRKRERNPEEAGEEPRKGTVRTFEQMAEVARGVKRVGVLRMDVDNLGQILGARLEDPTMPRVSALSAALDRFFVGRLNVICEEVNALGDEVERDEDRGGRLYVIYAGGDDLFVVGSWDLLPELAKRVRDEFATYTGGNPALHLSAGIVVQAPGAPLYQMARRAGRAEHQAKEHVRDGREKDAISFLGMALKWDEWPQVVKRRQDIQCLVEDEKVPRALIRILLDIYGQFEEQSRERHRQMVEHGELRLEAHDPDWLYYGPWMWRQAYALSRLASRVEEPKVASAIRSLQVDVLSPEEIRYMGMAARWAELLTRKEGDEA